MKERYPGVRPFSTDQKDLFFGRDKDIEQLYHLVQLEKQVLVYSKSGLGKTSLVNAGLIPKLLETEKYTPLSIRFTAFSESQPSPLEITKSILNQVDGNSSNTLIEAVFGQEEESLWMQLKKLQLSQANRKEYILVFDQFEELFSYPDEQIQTFKDSLATLLNEEVPAKYRQVIAEKRRENRELLNRENIALLHQSLPLKAVFIIRSDRLNLLNKLTDRIPHIQQVYYELLPLSREQAKDAILEPAMRKGEYIVPPFGYSGEALEDMLKYLTHQGQQPVESTHLQILCNYCEQMVEEKAGKGSQKLEIQLGDLPAFKDIFLDFYRQTIGKLPREDQPDAELFIENELIRKGQRISLDGRVISTLKESTLKSLVSYHLLRAQRNTTGGTSYELSHDTLVAPVLEAKKLREAKAAKEKAERDREEELRKAREKADTERQERERTQQQLRKVRILLIVAVVALIAAAVAIGYAFQQKDKAEELLSANVEKDRLNRIEKYSRFKAEATSLGDKADYEAAIDKLILAKEFTADTSEINQAIERYQRDQKKLEAFDRLLKEGEGALALGAFDKTISFYREAAQLQLFVRRSELNEKLRELMVILEKKERNAIENADAVSSIDPETEKLYRRIAADYSKKITQVKELLY
jgi:hypothetical protein